MRINVSSHELAHLWFHQTQSHAKAGNFYFNHTSIFSYGGHFEIARIDHSRGKRIVFFTERGYSNSTARHKSRTRQAIPQSTEILFVPDVALVGHHSRMIAAFKRDMESQVLVCAKSRGRFETEESKLNGIVNRLNRYCEYFKLRGRHKAPPIPSRELLKKRAELATRREAKAKAAREIAYKKMLEQRAAELPAVIDEWRASGNGMTYEYRELLSGDLMRVVGDEVITTRGARVPLEHIKRALPIVLKIIERGELWETNGHTIHVGHYQLERILPDGTVIAGCHTFKADEVKALAAQLSLTA